MGMKSRPLFSPAWQEALRHIPESAMIATVEIFDPNLTEKVYDPILNTYTETKVILATCPARVQPLRSAVNRESPGNDTTVQTVLVSIPLRTPIELRRGYWVRVTECEMNPDLLRYTLTVNEFMDSSNPIERTFLCESDQENV